MTQTTTTGPLDGIDGQLMVMAAHRYCLGRASYIVSTCVDWLLEWKDQLTETTRHRIIKETLEELWQADTIERLDRGQWLRLVETWWPELTEEQRRDIRSAMWKPDDERPWPLQQP